MCEFWEIPVFSLVYVAFRGWGRLMASVDDGKMVSTYQPVGLSVDPSLLWEVRMMRTRLEGDIFFSSGALGK